MGWRGSQKNNVMGDPWGCMAAKVLTEEARNQYLQKLRAVGLEICPLSMDDSAWLNDPTEWRAIQYADVYNYLIESSSTYASV